MKKELKKEEKKLNNNKKEKNVKEDKKKNETKKDNKEVEIDYNNKSKKELTAKQKEIIITIVTLLLSVIVGFFIGKYLYEVMNGPI